MEDDIKLCANWFSVVTTSSSTRSRSSSKYMHTALNSSVAVRAEIYIHFDTNPTELVYRSVMCWDKGGWWHFSGYDGEYCFASCPCGNSFWVR
jgi:hypothetical protein